MREFPILRDGSIDAAPDSSIPTFECGRGERFTVIGEQIDLEDGKVFPEGNWVLANAPGNVEVVVRDAAGYWVRMDTVGNYTFNFFEARNPDVSRCNTVVRVVTGPPVAVCPQGPLRTLVNEERSIDVEAVDDVGEPQQSLTVSSRPNTAMERLEYGGPSSRFGHRYNFLSSTPGDYRLTYRVSDAEGQVDQCEFDLRVIQRPVLDCPSPQVGPTRQPLTVVATATDDTSIASSTWTLLSQPLDGGANLNSSGTQTTFVPRKRGEYRLRLTVVDTDGLDASCEILAVATPTGPTAICPADLDTAPLREITLEGNAEDDGTIVSRDWSLVSRPEGSAANPPSPVNAMSTQFRPDIAGEYRVRFQVQDEDGNTDACITTVRALSTEGIRVEIFWDTPSTDMDTHLLQPEGLSWFGGSDCYYANCIGGLAWGDTGDSDDPSLDIDDVDGFGPENINIVSPYPGTYRVGIHAFSGDGRVTVRIYCGGTTSTARVQYGPVLLPNTDVFWRVADIQIMPGNRCEVTSLDLGGQPNLSDRFDANNRR